MKVARASLEVARGSLDVSHSFTSIRFVQSYKSIHYYTVAVLNTSSYSLILFYLLWQALAVCSNLKSMLFSQPPSLPPEPPDEMECGDPSPTASISLATLAAAAAPRGLKGARVRRRHVRALLHPGAQGCRARMRHLMVLPHVVPCGTC